jgi:hypothetical protein
MINRLALGAVLLVVLSIPMVAMAQNGPPGGGITSPTTGSGSSGSGIPPVHYTASPDSPPPGGNTPHKLTDAAGSTKFSACQDSTGAQVCFIQGSNACCENEQPGFTCTFTTASGHTHSCHKSAGDTISVPTYKKM